jgi:hypothetical protein
MRYVLLLALAAGCAKKCPSGYIENPNPHLCVGVPQGYTLEKQEKGTDQSWSGQIALRPPDEKNSRSDVFVEWYDGANLKEHVDSAFDSWTPYKGQVQEIEILKQGDLPGGGRFALRKIVTQHPELPHPVPTVKFEARSVLAAGPRVVECTAAVSDVGLNAPKNFQPDPSFIESCNKIAQ